MSFFVDFIRDLLRRIREIIRRILDWLRDLFPVGGGGGPVENIPGCCGLAVPQKECNWSGSKDQFTCPPGFHPTFWTCCEGTQFVACGECSTSEHSCFGGPWECSIWWPTNQPC